MEWIEVLSTWFMLMIILTTIVFALIGIGKVHGDYKESKWQKKYGAKHAEIQESAERTEWKNMEQLRDKAFLFEEVAKENGFENIIDKINRIISEIKYDDRYNTWKKNEAKWKVYALFSMAGGFGSSEKAQADLDEDFERYEEQIRQELRMKLVPASYATLRSNSLRSTS